MLTLCHLQVFYGNCDLLSCCWRQHWTPFCLPPLFQSPTSFFSLFSHGLKRWWRGPSSPSSVSCLSSKCWSSTSSFLAWSSLLPLWSLILGLVNTILFSLVLPWSWLKAGEKVSSTSFWDPLLSWRPRINLWAIWLFFSSLVSAVSSRV